MSEDPLSLYRFRTLADAKTETPSYSWEDRWLYNAAGVVSGRGGAGKTTYVLDKLALATVGRLPGRYFGRPSKVAMLGTLEDGESPAKLRIQAAAGDPELVLIPEFPDFETGQPQPFTMTHLDMLRQFLGDLHVRIAAIDQFNLLIRDPNKGADVARVLPPLNQVAQNVGCTIVGINHFRKSGGIGGDLVAGSIMIRNYSRFLILMADQGEDEPRVCTLDKLNLSRMQGSSWQFTLESAQVPTDDGGIADMAIVRELGDTDASVQDVVNRMYADAQNTNSDQDENEAQAFILDYLADHSGEAVAGEVIKAGRAAGFNEGELKDARRRCKNPKIKSRKSGKPWVWAIEQVDEPNDEGGKGGKGGRSEDLATLPPSPPPSEKNRTIMRPRNHWPDWRSDRSVPPMRLLVDPQGRHSKVHLATQAGPGRSQEGRRLGRRRPNPNQDLRATGADQVGGNQS